MALSDTATAHLWESFRAAGGAGLVREAAELVLQEQIEAKATEAIGAGGRVPRTHRDKHDPSREHRAFANADGRPSRTNAARNPPRAVTQLPTPTRRMGTGT
ncbi:MAG: hypothetical protein F4121_00395 [Acidimicrobiia bacterium]|nr:hypothetical protein [Acidimicrobiia bacterium]MYI18584.1 hypothetical protein [Acidimicrobiia bacterium]